MEDSFEKKQQPTNPLAAASSTAMGTVATAAADDEVDEGEDVEETAETESSPPPPPPPMPPPPQLNLEGIADSLSAPSAAFALHKRANSRVLSMTNRRQQLDAAQYLQRQADIFAWLSRALGRDVTAIDQLVDGVLLCELCNLIKRGAVPAFSQRPTGLFAKLGNAQAFTEAAEAFGVPDPSLFAASDLVQRANLPMVFVTLDLFARAVCKEPYSFAVPYEPAATPGKFTREQTAAVELQTKAASRTLSTHAREQFILHEHTIQMKQFQEKVASLETELQDARSSVKSRVEEYERRMAEMRQQSEVQHVEFTGLQAKLETITEEHRQCEARVQSLVVRAEEAERKCQEEVALVATLEAKLEHIAPEKTATEDVDALKRRIAELERLLAELQAKYDALLKKSSETAELEGQLADEREKTTKFRELVAKLRAEVDQKSGFAEDEATRLQEELSSQQEKARKQVAAVERILKQEREQHAHQLAALQEQQQQLQEPSSNVATSSELETALVRIHELEEQLKQVVPEKKKQKPQTEDLRSEVERLKAQVQKEHEHRVNAEEALKVSKRKTATRTNDSKHERELQDAHRALKDAQAAATARETQLRAENEQLARNLAREKREHEAAIAEIRRLKTAPPLVSPRPRIQPIAAPSVTAAPKEEEQQLPGLDFTRSKEPDMSLELLRKRYEEKIGLLNKELQEAREQIADYKQRLRVLQSGRQPDMSATMQISRDAQRYQMLADRQGLQIAELERKCHEQKEEIRRLKSDLVATRAYLASIQKERDRTALGASAPPSAFARMRPHTTTTKRS